MKKLTSIALIVGSLSGLLHASEFDIGISGSDRGISGFSLSVGDYYRVPQREIVMIERSIPRDEMGVVYFLAQRSHRSANYITDLRLRGISWWDISIRLGLDPRTLYVVNSHRYSGPPYGQAYGYHKEGKRHRLRDAEIVELVNVRFLSAYHGVSVDEVISHRRGGEGYMNIDNRYRAKKHPREQRNEDRRDDRRSNGDKHGNQGKGHGNDKGNRE